ncbi:MAG: hypothetical protein KDK99_09715 [Verrucomicrobiales bacterium]|nr:hypothetical protein [Verrucomicrobiales bacterium]
MQLSSSTTPAGRLAVIAALILTTLLSSVKAQSGNYAASYHAAQAAAYQRQQQAVAYYQYQQQMAAYQAYQQQMAAYQRQQQEAAARTAYRPQQDSRQAAAAPASMIRFDGRYVTAPANSGRIAYAVAAANSLQGKPYRRGGGHSKVEDSAYDCSGTVSYVLIKAGLLKSPLPSSGFAKWGEPGEGRFITVWVKPGEHVFMTICGLRLDTTGGRTGEGPRWRTAPRSTSGFSPRHPAGF